MIINRPPRYLTADSVVSQNRAGAANGVRHLISHGHRRIAYLGDLTSIATAQERFDGYQDALRARPASTLDRHLVRHDLHTVEAAAAAATELLAGPNPPTALFSEQNLVTIGTVRALREMGLQHRTALVGFDDFGMADLLEPAVTVVAQDPVAIGTLATEILFRRIDGEVSPIQEHVIPTHLIERESGSGSPPPAGSAPDLRRDRNVAAALLPLEPGTGRERSCESVHIRVQAHQRTDPRSRAKPGRKG